MFAGVTLHLTGEQLLRRGFDLATVAGLILPVFAVPAVAYAASQSMSGIAALSLLAVALQGFVWFVVDGDTDAVFTCGLALAACFFFDPIAIFYAIALGAAAFFFAVDRFRTTRAAAPATVAVITFPTVFVTLARCSSSGGSPGTRSSSWPRTLISGSSPTACGAGWARPPRPWGSR
ncbi:hypothetical protein LWC33_23315 [Pseudonocardia sp. RS11V-5]|uniref:hypothetical protein n=1 Tax=Pseudonocardia terrae TaxID=2905831 RepID=UPI001E50CD75|nr:hypothetical protein [Pseudonocardia terrae]MCE3554373.1 hypothetical protein [Pseudonocardia terrae]